jgi:transposase-like protein
MSTLRDLRGVPFAQVETELLRDPTITPQCKALYSLLVSYGPDRIFPGQERLARDLGTTRQTISKWLRELRKKGIISWVRRGSTSNEYQLLGYGQCKAEVTSEDDVKPSLQQMSSQVDNRCKASFTRSISSELDPVKKTAPDGDSPNDDWPSESNFTPRDELAEQEPITKSKDYLGMSAEVEKRTNGAPSWTVTGPEGANPWENGPVRAFCTLTHMPNAPPGSADAWGREFERIATRWKATPEQFIMAVGMIAKDKKHDWRSFTSPFNPSFESVVDVMLSRVMSGQTTNLVISND